MCPSWNWNPRRMKLLPRCINQVFHCENGIRNGGLCKNVTAKFSSSGVQLKVMSNNVASSMHDQPD